MWRSCLGPVALSALLLVAAPGCSSGAGSEATSPPGFPATSSSSSSSDEPTAEPTSEPTAEPTETADGALTDSALADTLLRVSDLPDGFREVGSGLGAADDPGCLTLTGQLDRLGAESVSEVQLVAEDEAGAAGVLSRAFSDGDATVLRQGLNRFAAALRSCKSVDARDDDGARTRLTITTDRRPTSGAVERQVNFAATGTVSGSGTAYPYRLRYSASLVGRTITVVAGFEAGDSSTGLLADLPRLGSTVIDRLLAAGADD